MRSAGRSTPDGSGPGAQAAVPAPAGPGLGRADRAGPARGWAPFTADRALARRRRADPDDDRRRRPDRAGRDGGEADAAGAAGVRMGRPACCAGSWPRRRRHAADAAAPRRYPQDLARRPQAGTSASTSPRTCSTATRSRRPRPRGDGARLAGPARRVRGSVPDVAQGVLPPASRSTDSGDRPSAARQTGSRSATPANGRTLRSRPGSAAGRRAARPCAGRSASRRPPAGTRPRTRPPPTSQRRDQLDLHDHVAVPSRLVAGDLRPHGSPSSAA